MEAAGLCVVDEELFNEVLLKEGYAQLATIPQC